MLRNWRSFPLCHQDADVAMTSIEQSNSAPHLAHIEDDVTIYRAAGVKQTLLTPIVESVVVEFDLPGAAALGLQLLMLAKKTDRPGTASATG
jgi:hypothetical protein